MSHTTEIQRLLVRHQAGDRKAIDELIRFAESRLRVRASQMLRNDRLKRWEQTDDLLQEAMLKLQRALEKVRPDSPERFFGLAALQVRRTLFDLARKHFGPRGGGKHHHTDGKPADAEGGSFENQATQANGPKDWTKFYEAVEALPEKDRQVLDLTWTNGLTHAAAAEVLGVDERTIRRRWLSIRSRFKESLLTPE